MEDHWVGGDAFTPCGGAGGRAPTRAAAAGGGDAVRASPRCLALARHRTKTQAEPALDAMSSASGAPRTQVSPSSETEYPV